MLLERLEILVEGFNDRCQHGIQRSCRLRIQERLKVVGILGLHLVLEEIIRHRRAKLAYGACTVLRSHIGLPGHLFQLGPGAGEPHIGRCILPLNKLIETLRTGFHIGRRLVQFILFLIEPLIDLLAGFISASFSAYRFSR